MNQTVNTAASVRQKLLNISRTENRVFNEVLQYYAMERFLYRLGQSPYANHFVLKGAFVFRIMEMPVSRPTRDLDFLGITRNSVENVVNLVKEICEVTVPEDGLIYDPVSVCGKVIKGSADYPGVKVSFLAYLGKARINMQLDVGFADVVTPEPKTQQVPTILPQFAAPVVRVYPPPTIVAEKFQAMVDLGMMNSRLKDFYDVWFLSENVEFSFSELKLAVHNTFIHRQTEIPSETPIALTADFAITKQVQWNALIRKNHLDDAPADFSEVLILLQRFLVPICLGSDEGLLQWVPGRGWG